MKKHAAPSGFWKFYRKLPKEIRLKAKEQYQLLKENRHHPSLHFKNVNSKKCIWSARVNIHYRALAVEKNEGFIWFWIGNHPEYEKIIK